MPRVEFAVNGTQWFTDIEEWDEGDIAREVRSRLRLHGDRVRARIASHLEPDGSGVEYMTRTVKDGTATIAVNENATTGTASLVV